MTILAIDGSYTLHRAKNVLMTLIPIPSGSTEQQKNTVIEKELTPEAICSIFFSMLPKKIEELYGTSVYVLWDFGRCKYRANLFDEYKLQRVKTNPSFLEKTAEHSYIKARSFLHTNLPSIGICSLLVPGVEADDLAYYLSHTKSEGILVSDDKDWFLNMNTGWKLCRAMRYDKADYIIDWERFRAIMGVENSNISPRDAYLYEKAMMGDKDEIPRITTPAPAKRIAKYLAGITKDIISSDFKLLESSKIELNRNMKLANTDWLISDPNIVNMPNVLNKEHSRVVVNDNYAFLEFAAITKSISYVSRWNEISKNLKY